MLKPNLYLFRSTKLDESKYDFIFVKNLRELWETIMDIYLINKEKFGEFSTINEVWWVLSHKDLTETAIFQRQFEGQ